MWKPAGTQWPGEEALPGDLRPEGHGLEVRSSVCGVCMRDLNSDVS